MTGVGNPQEGKQWEHERRKSQMRLILDFFNTVCGHRPPFTSSPLTHCYSICISPSLLWTGRGTSLGNMGTVTARPLGPGSTGIQHWHHLRVILCPSSSWLISLHLSFPICKCKTAAYTSCTVLKDSLSTYAEPAGATL